MTSAVLTMDILENAKLPWLSIDAATAVVHLGDFTTQAQKDFCLYSCPYANDCACCDACDGKGHLRPKGRPRHTVTDEELLRAIKNHKVAAVSRMYGVSRNYIYRVINRQER